MGTVTGYTGKIIDFHAHLYRRQVREAAKKELTEGILSKILNYSQWAQQSDFTKKGLLDSMRETGIEKTVLLTIASRANSVAPANRYTLDCIQDGQNKSGFIGFGTVHPKETNWEDTLNWVKENGFMGIKIHSMRAEFAPLDPIAMKIYKRTTELNLILLMDTFNPPPNLNFPEEITSTCVTPEMILRIHNENPSLKLVAAHGGGVFKYRDTAQLLIGVPNIWMDLSFTVDNALGIFESHRTEKLFPNPLTKEELVEMLRQAKRQLLFGSDHPTIPQWKAINDVSGLARTDEFPAGLTEEELDMIFYKNAARMLNLDN